MSELQLVFMLGYIVGSTVVFLTVLIVKYDDKIE